MRAGLRPWPRVWGRGGPEGAPAWRFAPQSPPGAYLLPASRAAGRSGPSPCPAGRGRTGRLGLGRPLGPCRQVTSAGQWDAARSTVGGKRAGECCPEPLAGAQPGDGHLGRAGPGWGLPRWTRPPGSPCGQAAPRGRAAWRAGPIGGWGPLRRGLGVAAARLSRAARPLTVTCVRPPARVSERARGPAGSGPADRQRSGSAVLLDGWASGALDPLVPATGDVCGGDLRGGDACWAVAGSRGGRSGRPAPGSAVARTSGLQENQDGTGTQGPAQRPRPHHGAGTPRGAQGPGPHLWSRAPLCTLPRLGPQRPWGQF